MHIVLYVLYVSPVVHPSTLPTRPASKALLGGSQEVMWY